MKLNCDIHVHHHEDGNAAVAKTLHTIVSLLGNLITNQEKIMSAISDYAAKVDAHNEKIDTAVSGIQSDFESLKADIATLQNSAGQITPEDQATLDRLEARSAAIADKLDALDALTPPKAPA